MLARELLSRPSEKVRFFGALTLIVKLNTDRYAVPIPGLWQASPTSQASLVLMKDATFEAHLSAMERQTSYSPASWDGLWNQQLKAPVVS